MEDSSSNTLNLLRKFLSLQLRRAEAYAKLRDGFSEYMISGVESTYQQLCSEVTIEFSDCSKQVREIESQFLNPDCFRDDLARLLRSVQELEKQKLHLTATIQVLKKAGRPSERVVTHENSVQGVQEAVTSINEHLEEIRYEIAALESE
uniref:Uncharacterized protein n=1 Tax=Chenopodium quinoa TaxID=63459 RepID=A0A803LK09_CHEQI